MGGRKDQITFKHGRYQDQDGWWFVTGTKRIRETATGNIWLWVEISAPPDGIVYLDGASAVVED